MDIKKRIEKLESLLKADMIKFRLYNGVEAEISNEDLKRVLTKAVKGESLEGDLEAGLILQADEDSFDPADGSIVQILAMLIRSREVIDPERAKVVEMLSEIVNGKDRTEVQ